MLELTVVLAIVLIVAALAVPIMSGTIANYKLDAGGHASASLMQRRAPSPSGAGATR